MAEGDSIRRIAERLGAALAGSAVTARSPGPRRPEGLAPDRLDGAEMVAAESRGKHLLLRFSGDLVLHSHLGMRGSWHLYGAGERWRRPAHRAWIALANGPTEAVNFDGSSLRLVRASQLERDPRLARLGPDILDPGIPAERLAASLRTAGAEVELGEALLDQSVIAGVGNIFKSEGCFAAAVDPWRRLGDLGDEELLAVAERTRELMEAAVRTGRQPQRVYRRAGRPCPRCGGTIRSRAQGDDARVTYWCGGCQR
jgi:endonuclease-8